MIILAGFWDLGYNSPLREAERWDFMCKDFEVDAWYMEPISGVNSSHLTAEHANILEVFDLHPNIPAVFVDESATETLDEFVHPTDAIYIFGKSGYSPLAHKREGDYSIKISTPKVGGLWADQAAAIILYDRLKKS